MNDLARRADPGRERVRGARLVVDVLDPDRRARRRPPSRASCANCGGQLRVVQRPRADRLHVREHEGRARTRPTTNSGAGDEPPARAEAAGEQRSGPSSTIVSPTTCPTRPATARTSQPIRSLLVDPVAAPPPERRDPNGSPTAHERRASSRVPTITPVPTRPTSNARAIRGREEHEDEKHRQLDERRARHRDPARNPS